MPGINVDRRTRNSMNAVYTEYNVTALHENLYHGDLRTVSEESGVIVNVIAQRDAVVTRAK